MTNQEVRKYRKKGELLSKSDEELIAMANKLVLDERSDLTRKDFSLYREMKERGLLYVVKSKYRSVEEFATEMWSKYGPNATRSQFNKTDRRLLHDRALVSPELLILFPVKGPLSREQVLQRCRELFPGKDYEYISQHHGSLSRLLKKYSLERELP